MSSSREQTVISTDRDNARALRAELEQALEDLVGSEREVRRLRRVETMLKRELTEAREADPRAKLVREALEHWKSALKKKGNTKVPIDGKRADVVRRALKWGHTLEEIKQAIDGAARFPYVVDFKRGRGSGRMIAAATTSRTSSRARSRSS
jgi:hypothetical protein